MKKSLVLAMAMALGVTASAYAANPFSDVPAGHWAYDSISKLAAAGVVEGYPDGTFKGDNLMTRYEMAQIVAKAMAKGANVDALAAEFADELDNLGVRVAALEKKADNVKITGQIRYNYSHVNKGHDSDNLRTRLYINGQINEDWSYTAMLQNQEKIAREKDIAGEKTSFQRAYLDGKVGGLKVTAGRYSYTAPTAASVLPFGSDLYDTRIDGITVKYGKGVSIEGTVGKMTDDGDFNKFAAANIAIPVGKAATLNGGYYNLNHASDAAKGEEIVNVGLQVKLGKNAMLVGDWLKANSDNTAIDGNDGYAVGVSIGGANKNKPGTFGFAAKYFDLEAGTSIENGWNATTEVIGAGLEAKGYAVGAYYTIAKGIVAGVEYYDMDVYTAAGKKSNDTLWSQLVFSF